MTGLGVLVGLWLISISIDRMTDKLCSMLKKIEVKFGTLRVRGVEPGEEGK